VATVALAAAYSRLAAVVIGTTAGMLAANLPVVLLGNLLARKLPMRAIHIGASVLFAALGLPWAGLAVIVDAGGGDVSVAEPFLHFGNVGLVVERIGSGRRPERMRSNLKPQSRRTAPSPALRARGCKMCGLKPSPAPRERGDPARRDGCGFTTGMIRLILTTSVRCITGVRVFVAVLMLRTEQAGRDWPSSLDAGRLLWRDPSSG
jgi:hypothetical protein